MRPSRDTNIDRAPNPGVFLRRNGALGLSGILGLIACFSILDAATLYVSTEGKAHWSGKLPAPNEAGSDGPLPSLKAAQEAIRRLRVDAAPEPFEVRLRGGTYRLKEPLVFGPEDSGSAQNPIVYAAYPNEGVVLSGGTVVKEWRQGKGPIWTAKVTASQGTGTIPRQLFVNGRRATRARSPNLGFYRSLGKSSRHPRFQLPFPPGLIPAAWSRSGVEAVVLLRWATMRRPIVEVDAGAAVATLAGDSGGTEKTPVGDVNARFYLENAREALDAAGEWFYDVDSGELLYWPLSTEDLTRDEVVVSFLPTLVRLEGRTEAGQPVQHLRFRGLAFRHTDWDPGPNGFADQPQAAVHVPAAFEAVSAEHCSVEECSFSQLGGYAISFGHATRSNRITENTIFDVGAGGIKLGDTRLASRTRGRSADNLISDNHIHHIGQFYQGAIGILVLQSSRNQIVHNNIHHTYYTAISVGWTWGYEPNQCSANRIEYNFLHHICQGLLNDVGAIYILGVQPGTTIRNNLIHEVQSFAGKGRGIYLDEGSAEILVENNIVYGVKSAGFHQHYGRDNLIRNNIFAWNDDFQFSRARPEAHRSYTFEGNIVLFDRGGLLGGKWEDTGFEFSRNLYYDVRGEPLRFGRSTWEEWRAKGHDAGSLVADPGFADAATGDFTLPPDSPAWKIGFQRIDIDTVGPRARAKASQLLPDRQ